ncbi:cysteine dioxygenase [Collimonas pratensis]|uniref:Cysteine dioxygenase type I n=1 Tax=Collimonas pratensis TaxID=279113 RepID=A0ABM5Z6X6_9BURK|nr:cysteine dioxygenase [Collimonas pratensis]AMP14912.1 cysteine dioxygenase type I [Collimonas pratensis]
MSHAPNPGRLRHFVTAFAALLDSKPPEVQILRDGGALLRQLIAVDDWLPDAYALPQPERYQQYLLHADSAERFSIVSFVWGPGQATPIHDHTVWGLIGMLRGAETSQAYRYTQDGRLQASGAAVKLTPGAVELLSPGLGDIHKVHNTLADSVSVSIHVYGANIGAVQRSVFAEDGSHKTFISGYSNTHLPNIWDRSKELKQP